MAAEDSTAVEEGTTAVGAVEGTTAEVVDTTTVEEVTTAAGATTADITAATAAIGDTRVSDLRLDTGLVGGSVLVSVGEDIGRRIHMVTVAGGRSLTIRTITLIPTTTLLRVTCPANRTFPTGRTFPTRAVTIRMLTLR